MVRDSRDSPHCSPTIPTLQFSATQVQQAATTWAEEGRIRLLCVDTERSNGRVCRASRRSRLMRLCVNSNGEESSSRANATESLSNSPGVIRATLYSTRLPPDSVLASRFASRFAHPPRRSRCVCVAVRRRRSIVDPRPLPRTILTDSALTVLVSCSARDMRQLFVSREVARGAQRRSTLIFVKPFCRL